MYNQNYEEYMRSVLGYNPIYSGDYRNTYEQNIYMTPTMHNQANENDMYPEIYKIVYPMVKKACSNPMQEVTEAEVERITMEIFMAVEDTMSVETKVTVQNRVADSKSTNKNVISQKEDRSENRQRRRNTTLQDLIRILVLRELLGRPNFPGRPGPGPRPPFPGGPGPRPPFSGGPGPRPPIQPRAEFPEYYY